MILNKKMVVALLMTRLIFSNYIDLIRPSQVNTFNEKLFAVVHNREGFSEQEKVKYRYVGMEKCASVCHNNDTMGFQYDIMKNGPHSNAFKILVSKKAAHYAVNAGVTGNPQENAVCLKCHITGAGLDTSFFAPTFNKEEGVTCEACHKGAFIPKAFIPKETDCVICHDKSAHKMRKFDFIINCASIAHPRPKVKPVKK
jgi:hypothetical protein